LQAIRTASAFSQHPVDVLNPLVNIGSAGVFTAYPVPTFVDNNSHRNEAIKSVIGVILMVLSSREAAYSVAAPVAVDKGVVAPACGVIPPESAGCLVPVGGAPAPAPRRGVLLRIGGVAPAVDAAVVVVVDSFPSPKQTSSLLTLGFRI
jgi:hypothetical protein